MEQPPRDAAAANRPAPACSMTSRRPGETIPAGFERVVPGPGLAMLVAQGLDGAKLASQILTPAADAPARHFGRAGLHAVALADGGDALIRSCLHGGILRGLTRKWFISRPPRPFAELAVTAAARERGLATPEVLAALVARGLGPWYRGWLVTRELKGTRTLWTALLGRLSRRREAGTATSRWACVADDACIGHRPCRSQSAQHPGAPQDARSGDLHHRL